MKKIIFLITFASLTVFTAQAQISSFGLHLGGGLSRLSDDIISNGCTMGAAVGAFVTYDFSNAHSVIANHFYLQSGLNMVRRGGHDKGVFVVADGVSLTRKGSVEAWYLQLPVLASFRWELPIRHAGHYITACIGPAVSYGLFGSYDFDQNDSGQENSSMNIHINDDKAFDHIKRFDVSVLMGIGYQYRNWFARVYMDYGFLAIDEGEDILRQLENTQTGSNKSTAIPNANVVSYLLMVGYQFPIYHKR